ncbi:amidase [Halorarum halophilum]|uniref:Amidase n=1 Tax=Halorarum halophilum TaxID=2743090 RepID=A0A7D5KY32_9EURY|nr:amidase [Halobaculum halophilum]QLG29218.1 amidase [Halobaculum halophilum]
MYVDEAELADVVASFRTGRSTPASYLDRCRDRVERVDATVRAFLREDDRWTRVTDRLDALDGSGESLAERPPLYGVPVGVKDIFNVDGLSTRAGTDLPPELFDGPESAAWRRLADAGAVPLGKTVTTEFAYFEPGPTRNPHDTTRTPGGSSSGSAAAVAAGLCPLALGSQTIGSVIRPAAFCGVVGFKPTHGRVPTDGVVPVSPTLDHVGTFTQDLEGAELAGAVLCDDWRTVPRPRGKPTLGVPDEAYLDQAEPVGRERFERQVERLESAGFDVRRTDALQDVEELNGSHERLMAAEMALAHRDHGWYPDHADEYASETRRLVEGGDGTTVAELGAARTVRRDNQRRLRTRMEEAGIDCWVTPAAPGPAPKGIDDTGDPAMNLPWTNAGFPAVTFPVESTEDGLPLGLQCVATTGADEELLRWARLVADELGR